MLEKIFFQSSMPRSGSTFFQNLIGSNPLIHSTPTDGVLELLFGARGNYTTSLEFKAQDEELMQKAFTSFCKSGLEAYCSALIDGSDKKYVVLKSRGWGVYREFLNTFYPDPKIICLVRDLKDIFCSYEKIYRKNQHKHNPIRDDAMARGTTVHKRMDEWANPQNTIGRAIERLFEINRLGYDDKILFIKYEDLCLYPKQQMIRVYEYLGIEYFDHDFDEVKQITAEDDKVFGLVNDLHTIRPKLEMRPSDAKQILGADVCDWIYNTYRWYYDKFGYKK